MGLTYGNFRNHGVTFEFIISQDEYIDHSVEPNKKARKEDLTPAPDVSQQQSYGQLTAEKVNQQIHNNAYIIDVN